LWEVCADTGSDLPREALARFPEAVAVAALPLKHLRRRRSHFVPLRKTLNGGESTEREKGNRYPYRADFHWRLCTFIGSQAKRRSLKNKKYPNSNQGILAKPALFENIGDV
jgi:hypothetical protein